MLPRRGAKQVFGEMKGAKLPIHVLKHTANKGDLGACSPGKL